MSFNRRGKLRVGAKEVARELRRKATDAEQVLWERLRANRLGGLPFYRQRPLYHDVTGRESFFIADFYCHRARLVIEIDGKIHEHCVEEDQERTKILNLMGYNVIRFTNQQVLEELPSVLAAIEQECRSLISLRHSPDPFPKPTR